MPRQFMIAFAKAAEGRKDELNEWFEKQHVSDLMEIPGFVSAGRVALSQMGNKAEPPAWDFMAMYEISADNVADVLKEAGVRMATGVIKMSDALDRTSSLTLLGSPISYRALKEEQ